MTNRFRLVLPGLGYLLVSLAATWPLVIHLRGRVPGFGDWGQNLWALWWTRQSVLSLGRSPFFTNYLFYPEGVTLLFHPLDVSDGLLALPLYGTLGGDVAYNLMILLSFVLGGWGAYLLALHLTGHRPAAFLAGLIFALSPYHFLRIDLGHLNLSSLQWIPFYTLFLLRFAHRGDKRSAALAVFFLVFTALNSWYYVIYCGLLSLAVLIYPRPAHVDRRPAHVDWEPKIEDREPANVDRGPGTEDRAPLETGGASNRPISQSSKMVSEDRSSGTGDYGRPKGSRISQSSPSPRSPAPPPPRSPAPLLRVPLVLLCAILLLSPLLLPMFRLLSATTLIGAHNPLRHSVDLLSLWVPGPPSTWAGLFEDVWISYAAQNREPGASAYLGYLVLGLSLAGLAGRRRRRQAVWWGCVAGGFTLLALGPQLQIDGQILDIFLPYHWLAALFPVFAITGIPGRFVVMTSLALAMLAAYGVANLDAWLFQLKRPHSSKDGRSGSSKPVQKQAARTESPPSGRKQAGRSNLSRSNQNRAVRSKLPSSIPNAQPAPPPPAQNRDRLKSFQPPHKRALSRPLLFTILALLIALEYAAVPLRLTSTGVGDFYQTLAADEENYALLDIKWDANFLMHAQTVHGKPLVGGWLARLPAEQAAYLDQPGLDRAFLYLLLGPQGTALTDPAVISPAIQTALAERDVRYIIDHGRVAGPWLEQLVDWPVVYEAEDMVVYGREE